MATDATQYQIQKSLKQCLHYISVIWFLNTDFVIKLCHSVERLNTCAWRLVCLKWLCPELPNADREIRRQLPTKASPEWYSSVSCHLEVSWVPLILNKNLLYWRGEWPFILGNKEVVITGTLASGHHTGLTGSSENIRQRSKGSSLRSIHTGFPGLSHWEETFDSVRPGFWCSLSDFRECPFP